MTLSNQPVLQLFALSSAVLVLTLYGLGILTARKRNQRKAVLNPEDVKVNSGAKVVDAEHTDVLRIKRAHLNLIENAVPFFVIGFLYTLTDPSMTMASILFFTFVGVRLFHAIFYLNAAQPFRTASFGIGALVNVVMLVQVVRAALPGLV
jgi:glutathione S-transferase